jgi:hypothetical protein
MSSKTAPTKLAKSGGGGGSNAGGLTQSPKTSQAAVNASPPHPSSPLKRQGDAKKSNSSLSSSIPSDISYKLCKKIAQLTKVIYYLNTKNEDHSTEIQSLVSVYEQEINDVKFMYRIHSANANLSHRFESTFHILVHRGWER